MFGVKHIQWRNAGHFRGAACGVKNRCWRMGGYGVKVTVDVVGVKQAWRSNVQTASNRC